MSSSSNAGIQNYDKMEDKDKAYVIKLSAILVTSIIAGILTGITYDENGGIAIIGFGLFFAVTLVMSYFIKFKYDLDDMNDQQIIRHGIAVGFLTYLFVWTTIFQFVYF